MTDRPLLQQFAATADAAAFGELVRRHGAMVLAAARRTAGEDADDVAQAAFILLSKKAAALAGRDCVAGWLYETTRLCARNARRARGRRQRALNALGEKTMRDQPPVDTPAWIAVLDDAIDQLPGDQRGVVLLRYLEGRSVADTAAALRLSPAAVAKRAERAMGRLRETFRAHGYAVSTEAAVSGMALQAAADPAHLAALLSGVTANAATAGASATAKLTATAMTAAKVKVAAVVAVALAATGGVAVPVVRHALATAHSASPPLIAPAARSAAAPTPAAPPAAPPVAAPTIDDVAAMRRTLALLDKQLPGVRFDGVALRDAMSFLTDTSNIPIDLDAADLATHGIDTLAPVNARLLNVKVDKILRTVLTNADSSLVHVVTGAGHIYVGTRQTAFAKLAVERRYAMHDLMPPTRDDAQRSEMRDRLTSLVTDTIATETWQADPASPGGRWRWDGETLVVTQTPAAQLKILDLVDALTAQRR